MVFGKSGTISWLSTIISYIRAASVSRLRCDQRMGLRRNPWKSRARIRATIARPVGYSISGRSPGIFVARRENRSSGSGERWHHSSMRDQGRAERYSRRICSALARMRLHLIPREAFSTATFKDRSLSHTLRLLIKPIYFRFLMASWKSNS